MALAEMRKDDGLAGLLEKALAKNPFRRFERWFQEAEAYCRIRLHDRLRFRRAPDGDWTVERPAP